MKAAIAIVGLVVGAITAHAMLLLSAVTEREEVFVYSLIAWILFSPPLIAAVAAASSYLQFSKLQRRIPVQELATSSMSSEEVALHYVGKLQIVPMVAGLLLLSGEIILFLILIDHPSDYLIVTILISLAAVLVFALARLGICYALRSWFFLDTHNLRRFFLAVEVVLPWVYIQLLPFAFFFALGRLEITFLIFMGVFYVLISPFILLHYVLEFARHSRELVVIRQDDWWRLNGKQASWVPRHLFQRWPHPHKTEWGKYKEAADLSIYGEENVARLRGALELLAADVDEQLANVEHLRAACEEVCAAFKRFAGDLGGEQWEAFDALMDELNSLPLAASPHDATSSAWLEETIRRNPHWQRARKKAASVLQVFGWEREQKQRAANDDFDPAVDPLASKSSF